MCVALKLVRGGAGGVASWEECQLQLLEKRHLDTQRRRGQGSDHHQEMDEEIEMEDG